MNDAFISYRRLNGAIAARRLRRRLLDYRFPRPLREKLTFRPLTIYLDSLYERATNDFFKATIVPALRDSKHLIVVQTPAALRPRPDGQKNWVVREIETFRALPQRDEISVALAAGTTDDPLPADLHETLPNIERVDIRRLGALGFGARDQVLSFIAALHGVSSELMPELRREEARRRAATAWAVAVSALVALAVLALLLGWALVSREDARRAERAAQHELAVSHVRAAAERDPPSEALAHAAKAVGLDPEYDAARTLLIDLLMERDWPLPLLDLPHPDGILEVAFSSDDSRFATRTDREVRLWRTRDGHPLVPPMGMDGHIYEMSFSPDWRTLLLATDKGWGAWDLATGRPLPIGERTGSPLAARSLGPDWILVKDMLEPPRLCDSATGGRCTVLPPILGTACGTRAIVLRDGRHVVADLPTQAAIGKPMIVAGGIGWVAFSEDCQWIATADTDLPKGGHAISLWRGDGTPVGRVEQAAVVTSLELSRDGSRLLATGDDHHARLWSVPGGELLADVPRRSIIDAADLRGDGSLAVTASAGGAELFDAQGERSVPLLHSQEVTAAAFSHDGTRLLTGSADAVVRLWDIRPGAAASLSLPFQGPRAIGFSRDGRRGGVCDGDTTALFDTATGRALAAFSHPPARLAAFDRDLRHCLLVASDETATVHELPSGRLIGRTVAHRGMVNAIAFDDSGTHAATAAEDGLRVWPLAAPAAGAWLRSPVDDAPYALRFVPFGGALAVGWRNGRFSLIKQGTVLTARRDEGEGSVVEIHIADNGVDALLRYGTRLWSLRTRAPAGPLLLPNGKRDVSATALSADGDRAATASDRKVFLWNARSGNLLIDPLPHPEPVSQVAFVTGGERLMTTAGDGVRLWDAATGVMLQHRPFSSYFTYPVLSADGSRLLVGSTDRTELFDVVNGSAADASELAAVAEAVAGFRVNANGALESLPQRAKVLQSVRAKVEASPPSTGDSSARFLRWFLADRASRQPSPFRPPPGTLAAPPP